MSMKDYVIVFDIETEMIPTDVSTKEKKKAIRNLKMHVACAYSYKNKQYLFFNQENIRELFRLFENADTIVGFNVLGFDYEVLKKYGLPPMKKLKKKTVDLMYLIERETGNRHSLDGLARRNLGRGKIFKEQLTGRTELQLKNICQNDVELTKELFELKRKGKLKYDKYSRPIRWNRRKNPSIEGTLTEKHVLEKCPKCGDKNLERIDYLEEASEMSEGQLAEYLAGNFGTIYCLKCKYSFDFEL